MKNFTLSVKNLIKRMDCAETHMGSIKHFQFRTSSSLIRGKISTFEKENTLRTDITHKCSRGINVNPGEKDSKLFLRKQKY
jgi:hypothetical protein